MPMTRRSLAAAAAIGAMLLAGPALATTMNFKTTLSGASEVPPTTSKGKGSLSATYDTDTLMLTWKGTVSGLTGPATAAHFHGPAAAGKNAGVMVPVTGITTGDFSGSAKLTADQAKALEGGMMYFNIHTKKDPKGEVRGQLAKAM